MSFVVGLVLSCGSVPGKDKLKKLEVDIGTDVITVVTNAPNIREGSRTVVATVGKEFEVNGEFTEVKKVNVGGVQSEGMICDSIMLGWKGGAAGIAVQVPESYALGSEAPTSKPRLDGDSAAVVPEPEISAKDIKAKEKLERKAQLAAKKAERKAGKAGKEAAASASGIFEQSANEDEDATEKV